MTNIHEYQMNLTCIVGFSCRNARMTSQWNILFYNLRMTNLHFQPRRHD